MDDRALFYFSSTNKFETKFQVVMAHSPLRLFKDFHSKHVLVPTPKKLIFSSPMTIEQNVLDTYARKQLS